MKRRRVALRAAAADSEARARRARRRATAGAWARACSRWGRALHEARDDTKLHEISHFRDQSAERRRQDAEVSRNEKEKEKESSAETKKNGSSGAVWDALAALHRASGDDVAARLCLTRAFDGLEASETRASRTRAALTAQIEGDASSARDIYDALLREDADEISETSETPAFDAAARSLRSRRLWFRERARCSQRLGDWDELALDIAEAVPPPWSVERLRAESDAGDGERAIPGAAAGGDALCFATRALARRDVERRFETKDSEKDAFPEKQRLESLDGSLDAILAHVAKASPAGGGDPVAAELGVELAVVLMARGSRTPSSRASPRARGSASGGRRRPPRRRSRGARCCSRCRRRRARGLWGRCARAGRSAATLSKPKRAGRTSVMENVAIAGLAAGPRTRAIPRRGNAAGSAAPPRAFRSPSRAPPRRRGRRPRVAARLRREVASLVRAARARRAGERTAYDPGRAVLTEGGRLAPADGSWLVQKAVVAPGAGGRAARSASTARAGAAGGGPKARELLRGVLRSLRRVRGEEPERVPGGGGGGGGVRRRARFEAGAIRGWRNTSDASGPTAEDGETGSYARANSRRWRASSTRARRRSRRVARRN